MLNAQLLFSNKNERESLLNLLKTYLFGNGDVEKYDPNKVYNAGDVVYIVDELTGKITIIQAPTDGITGPYNPDDWDVKDIDNAINTAINDLIMFSTYQPSEKINKLWIQPIEYGDHLLPEPIPLYDGDKYSMVFTGEIPIVEDVSADLNNTLTQGDIVLDTEGDYSMEIDQDIIDMFRDGGLFTIDEQEDVAVSNDKPTDGRAITWFDTDITDEE